MVGLKNFSKFLAESALINAETRGLTQRFLMILVLGLTSSVISKKIRKIKMPSVEKYLEIFKTALNVNADKVNETLKYNEIDEWDSIGHMTLVASLEVEYKISLETDDIVDFSSFKKGIEILRKYNIEIS